MVKDKKEKQTDIQTELEGLERFAFSAAKSIGSVRSLIIHTLLFVGIFSLQWFDFSFENILLILTTIVSLEAIYLSIFIQMSVNHQAVGLAKVHEDIEDISEDVEEISEDIEGLQEDVEEISEDIEDIQEEVKEIGEDVEEISDDIEENDQDDEKKHRESEFKLQKIENTLHQLLKDIEDLKK